MKQQRNIIHVELLDPPSGYNKHYYFGCVAAIYDKLTKEIVGIAKETLWNVINQGEYKGRKAIIRRGTLHTKDTHRGIKSMFNKKV